MNYKNGLHKIGRIFTAVALGLILLVPVVFCLRAGVLPDFKIIAASMGFILGYVGIGLIEAISYAPILGTGGQYLSFITGNLANLKLPCSLNAQSLAKVKEGSDEAEVISTISIAVSSIVTTLIICIGLIPLAVFSKQIVSVLAPVTPYVIPSIFGGLAMVLIARFLKLAVVPFALSLLVSFVALLIKPTLLSQSTMGMVGMVFGVLATAAMYQIGKKKDKKLAVLAQSSVGEGASASAELSADVAGEVSAEVSADGSAQVSAEESTDGSVQGAEVVGEVSAEVSADGSAQGADVVGEALAEVSTDGSTQGADVAAEAVAEVSAEESTDGSAEGAVVAGEVSAEVSADGSAEVSAEMSADERCAKSGKILRK